MHTYIGVGDVRMCSECGVDVRNIQRHDSFHASMLAELEKLKQRIAELERMANNASARELVGSLLGV